MPTLNVTKITSLVDPEVMAPMISAKLPKAIKATPYAKIDTTLQGRPGDTITIPMYKYIGDAEDLAEGITANTAELKTDTAEYKIKKAVKQVRLTDEAVLSGYGNPVGETNNQLGLSIASKIDNDVMDALLTSRVAYDGSANAISYNGIVDAIDLFQEEDNVEKVMFIHPLQVSELRKDANFISRDKYGNEVMVNGEIGMVANARIVASKKVPVVNGAFVCPIVELRPEEQTGDERSAVTIFLKRNVNVETERDLTNYTTLIGADEHYVVGLTDESKVVLGKFKATTIPSL